MATQIETTISGVFPLKNHRRVHWEVIGGEVFFQYLQNGKTVKTEPQPMNYSTLQETIGEFNMVNLITDITAKLRKNAHEPEAFHFSTAIGVFRIDGKDRVFADTNVRSPDNDGYVRLCGEDQVMIHAVKEAKGHGENRLATLQKMFVMVGSDDKPGCCSSPCMSCRGKMHGMAEDDTKVEITCLPVRSSDAKPIPVKISKEHEIELVEKTQAFKTTLDVLMNELIHTLHKTYGKGESTLAVLKAGRSTVENTSDKTVQDEINAFIFNNRIQKKIEEIVERNTPDTRKRNTLANREIGKLLQKTAQHVVAEFKDFAFADDKEDKFVKAMIELGEDKKVAINKRLVALLQNEFKKQSDDGNQGKIKKAKAVIVETQNGEFYFGILSEGTGPTKDGAVQNALSNAPNKRNIKAVYAMEYNPSLLDRYGTDASQGFEIGLYTPRELERVVKMSTYAEKTKTSSVSKTRKEVLLPDADLFMFPLNNGKLDADTLKELTWHSKLDLQAPNTYKNPNREK